MKWLESVAYVALGVLVAGSTYGESVELKPEGGTYVVPVVINNKITLEFTLDSGAADVSIPLDVFSTLRRTKTISQSDILGTGVYTLADGSDQRQTRFKIRSLKIGQLELRDVTASVAPPQGALLLGQSFLSRLQTWSVNNRVHVLYLNELPGEDHRSATSAGQNVPGPADPDQLRRCLARFHARNTYEGDVIIDRCKRDPDASPTSQTEADRQADRVYCQYMGFKPASCASLTSQTEADREADRQADRVYCQYMRQQQGFSPASCARP